MTCRIGPADTAFSYRDANWAQVIVGVDPDPANAGAIRQWTVDYWEATHPYAGGRYINFLMDEGQDRVRASYQRLARSSRLRPRQRLPRQPEHRAAGVTLGASAETNQKGPQK